MKISHFGRLSLTSFTIFSLTTAALFISCGSKPEEKKAEPVPVEVVTAKVVRGDLPLSMEFVGQTKGSIDAEIRARVDGVVTGVHFEEGKEVTEGQLLYTIDPTPYKAKVTEAQAKVAEAQARFVKADSDLKRIKPLAAARAVSQRDLDTSIGLYDAAKATIDVAKAALESAEIQLSYCTINSPTTGIIGFTKAKIGEYVGAPPNPVVLNTVSKIDPIVVRFAVSEQQYLYFVKLKQKQIDAGVVQEQRAVQMKLSDGTIYSHAGAVSSVDREIDPATGTLSVEASFPNPNKLIRPGQFAKLITVAETISGALMVPKRALREIQGQYQVFIVKSDSTIEPRTVKVGQSVGEQQVVEEGLRADEVIVTEGIQRLKAGMLVVSRTDNN